jgi:ubiquinone/menaquinone biosynthesis C-methylase UbiE
MTQRNCDVDTIDTFSKEWVLFDQSELPDTELQGIFAQYFRDFPWGAVGEKAVGMDVGCGTGRWAKYIAPRVGKLHCIDASSSAVEVARAKLTQFRNCDFHVASIDDLPVPDASMDFACCVGVLHYIPNPAAALKALTAKLKPGAPLLLYVYYALDDRPLWFRAIWAVQDRMRRVIAAAPFSVRYVISQMIAAAVYYPLARAARLAEDLGMNVENIPLSAYRRRSFYTMRADSLNRFANHLEHRFTRQAVLQIMEVAGLERVLISDGSARWVAVGYKR